MAESIGSDKRTESDNPISEKLFSKYVNPTGNNLMQMLILKAF
jgi:hypothetical protein